MSLKKKIILGLAVIIIGIQFFQPFRNQSEEVTATHIESLYTVPPKAKAILVQSCYDCHSNNTFYPWYSYIQPTRFFMESHINEGKENLNFNEWGNYSARKQNNKLDRIAKQIKSNEMPLSSYTMIHKNATLSATQKKEIINWISQLKDSL